MPFANVFTDACLLAKQKLCCERVQALQVSLLPGLVHSDAIEMGAPKESSYLCIVVCEYNAQACLAHTLQYDACRPLRVEPPSQKVEPAV